MTNRDPVELAAKQAIRDRVLRAIALNRHPGLHFAGHFLGIAWKEVSKASIVMTLADGPLGRNADGSVNLAVLIFLLDVAFASVARTNSPPGSQIATLRMLTEFTGAPLSGPLRVRAEMLGHTRDDVLNQLATSAVVQCGDEIVAYASGSFAALTPPAGSSLSLLPWECAAPHDAAPADEPTLEAGERAILNACDAALRRGSQLSSFIEHFWGGTARLSARGASLRLKLGPHCSNRVGQTNGGIMTGIAAATARAAAPANMRLNNISAWFISPGRGTALRFASRVLHAGRNSALVRTAITTAEGARVMEVVTQHGARR